MKKSFLIFPKWRIFSQNLTFSSKTAFLENISWFFDRIWKNIYSSERAFFSIQLVNSYRIWIKIYTFNLMHFCILLLCIHCCFFKMFLINWMHLSALPSFSVFAKREAISSLFTYFKALEMHSSTNYQNMHCIHLNRVTG